MKNKKFLLISLILAAVCLAGVLYVNANMRYSMLASVLQ